MKIISLILITLLASCVDQKSLHGNLPNADLVSILNIGKDNKKSISKILGEPTFKGVLGDNSYYYIGAVNSKTAFLKSKLKEQIVLELKFDKSNILRNIYIYDEKETMKVSMSSLETKTLGYRQSFLRQLLGNFGVAGVRKGGPIIGTGRADN